MTFASDNPRRAGLIDPAINNAINLGDTIISQSVRSILLKRCGFDEIVGVPSLRRPSKEEIRRLNRCETVFIGGTNPLSSNMNKYRQWRISFADILRMNRVVLLGVGWWQYQHPPNLFTRLFLGILLDRQINHSVRDSYSAEKLKQAGLTNVLNTTCPTLWSLKISAPAVSHKGRSVVTTLTCYAKDPVHDRRLIDALSDCYETVYFWPQGDKDSDYLRDIYMGSPPTNLFWLDPTVSEFDQLIQEKRDLDYVGTRLHGGIRALSRGCRSLILSVDNRAKEISRDTNLPCCSRQNTPRIIQMIMEGFETQLCLPVEDIDAWCAQFHKRKLAT